jgi:hypothetical protein
MKSKLFSKLSIVVFFVSFQLNAQSEVQINSSTNISSTTPSQSVKTTSIDAKQCDVKFKLPKLTYKDFDNRKPCKYCQKRYAHHSLSNVEYEQQIQQISYLNEALEYHLHINKANESHQKADRISLSKYIVKKYGNSKSLPSTDSSLPGILKQTANNTSIKNPSTIRKINKYFLEHDYCPQCRSVD